MACVNAVRFSETGKKDGVNIIITALTVGKFVTMSWSV